MRLTLRTLLAWKDGVLPPEERESLGEKVDASQVARHLVERIHTVVANPALSSPRIGAKGLVADANSVAEYLDNSLPAERLEAFETICLESDMHLAEVSASHEILAEVARDPEVIAPLDERRRRSLLESIEHRIQSRTGIVLGGAASPAALSAEAGVTAAHSRAGRREGAGPPVSAPASRAERQRVPWGAIALLGSALLLLVSLGLFFAQASGVFRRTDAARPPVVVAKERDGAADGVIGERVAVAAPQADDPVGAAETDAVAAAERERHAAPRGLAELLARADADEAARREDDAAGGADAPLPGSADDMAGAKDDVGEGTAVDVPVAVAPPEHAAESPPDAGPRKVRAGEALAIAAGARPQRTPRGGAALPDAGRETTPADIGTAVGLDARGGGGAIGFVAADGAVLRRVADGDMVSWEPVMVGGGIADGTLVVVPSGMRPGINLGGMSLRIEPRSVVRLWADDDGVPGVEPILGRVIVRAATPDARLALRCGGIDRRITAGLDGSVAAEVETILTRGEDGVGQTRAALFSIGRPLRVMPTGEAREPEEIPPRGGLRWSSAEPDVVQPVEATGRLADWATGRERLDSLERGAAEAFVGRLEALPEGSPPSAGLAEVLATMAIDRRVENRVFAAIALALVGEYDVAVESLCAEAPGRKLEGRQWKALEAAVVPMALGRGAASAERLRRAFEDRGPPGRAELLMQLARRPSDADLADGADRALVEALSDGSLVVRRFAAECLVEIVRPSTFDAARYRPDAAESLRREGASWWRSQREKGLVRRAGP